jgi:hypothetical protein
MFTSEPAPMYKLSITVQAYFDGAISDKNAKPLQSLNFMMFV